MPRSRFIVLLHDPETLQTLFNKSNLVLTAAPPPESHLNTLCYLEIGIFLESVPNVLWIHFTDRFSLKHRISWLNGDNMAKKTVITDTFSCSHLSKNPHFTADTTVPLHLRSWDGSRLIGSSFELLCPPYSLQQPIAVSKFRVCILQWSVWRHNTTWSLSQSEAPPDAPSAPCFWRTRRYDPSRPHISQDSLWIWKRRKKERRWRHCVP